MMKRFMFVALLVLILAFLAGCHPMHRHQAAGQGPCCVTAPQGQGTAMAGEEVRGDVLYTCACGDGCACNSMSKTPGNCKCGKPMAWGHVVKVEGNTAFLCQCAEGCKCKQNPDDPTLCACGKPLKKVDMSGSGMYFCNCGGSCTCNTVSDKPGDCRCGMQLKQR